MFEALVVLLRNTTWKCGNVERLIINYLRRRLQHYGSTQSSIKDMLQYSKSKGKQENQVFEAMERLEKRGIIKVISNPFAPTNSFNEVRKQGGI
jgi:hypothetical protein